MRIIVDMDGVIADFEAGFFNRWRIEYPNLFYIPLEKRNTFYIADQYPKEFSEQIRDIYLAPNFFRTLPPISGSIRALSELKSAGFDIFICTKPLKEYKNCVLEKYEWIDHHLGAYWVDRLIVSRDKTIIQADFLIDDNPKIVGCCTPMWTLILFDQPKNRKVENLPRLTWDNWKTLLLTDNKKLIKRS